MTEAHLVIRNEMGLHARTCAEFVKTAARFKSHVWVSRDDLEVNGKSIMGLLMLAAEEGAIIRVRTEGDDEAVALSTLKDLVESRFGGMP